MISSMSQASVADSTNSTPVTGVETGMGQDAFLKMFMAQMTNQNPLDPMDNTEFTAQLATFSQLEQLTKIADSMEGMTTLEDAVTQSTMVSYLGKEVTMLGDVLPVTDSYIGSTGYSLPENALVYAVITDETGSTVADISLGYQAAGYQAFQWNGEDDNGNQVPDGAYKVHIRAATNTGDPVTIDNQTVTGLVTGFQKGEDGQWYLLLGDAALPMDEVLGVRQTAGGAESASAESDDEEWEAGDILKKVLSVAGLAAMLI